MSRDFKALGSAIDDAYDRLRNFPEGERALAARVASECTETIAAVAHLLHQDANALLEEWSEQTLERYFELAAALLIAAQSERDELSLIKDLTDQLYKILEQNEPQKARQGARALLESLMLVIENVHQPTCQRILELLATLSNAPEGVIPPSREETIGIQPKHTWDKIDSDNPVSLRSLLQVGLYREVMTFLRQREDLSTARKSAESLVHILKPVVSFASRKGGVGKSILVFATAAWFLKLRPGAKVCIVDFDLSGPVWQYLLFPGYRPSHFLNDLISLEQGNQKGDFEFPDISTELVEPLLEKSTIDVEGTSLYLLSVADLPRTSRYLSIAVANNSESCFKFLTQLLSALQPLVDLVVIDNAPGLDSLPLLCHVLTTSVPYGCSAIISTPALHDLRGMTLELSDLYVLDRESAMVYRRPLWIVNKADAEARKFLSTKHKIMDLAFEVDAYNQILPDRPLIARAVSPSSDQFRGLTLPLDQALLAFGNINERGAPPLQDAFKAFLETDFFNAFVEQVGGVMLPLLTGDPRQEDILDAKL